MGLNNSIAKDPPGQHPRTCSLLLLASSSVLGNNCQRCYVGSVRVLGNFEKDVRPSSRNTRNTDFKSSERASADLQNSQNVAATAESP